MEGISLYDVKELLGHASLTTTERYAHLTPDRNKKAAATMDKVFQKKADTGSGMIVEREIRYYNEKVRARIDQWPVGIRAYYARIAERMQS